MLRDKLLFILIFPLCFLSCGKKSESLSKVIWGETDYYNDFLFIKYNPVIMTQKLEFDFNEDAQRLLNRDIEIEIVEKNERDKFVSAQNIKLYKNGLLCNGNVLKINPKTLQLIFA